MIEGPKRRGALLDLVLANKEELVGDAKVKGSLGCSDHEMMLFRILRAGRRVKSKLTSGLQESRLWPLQRSAWKCPMGCSQWKWGPRKLVNIQISAPSSLRVLEKKKNARRPAWMS